MSSKTIYPYVYRGENPITGEFYIGLRWANKLPSTQDLGARYKTSSQYVKPRFHEFSWLVLAEFFDKDSAYLFEQSLIRENWGNPLMLNRVCHDGYKRIFLPDEEAIKRAAAKRTGQKRTQETCKNISLGNTGRVVSDATRAKQSANMKRIGIPLEVRAKMKASRKGYRHSEETKAKMSESRRRLNEAKLSSVQQ